MIEGAAGLVGIHGIAIGGSGGIDDTGDTGDTDDIGAWCLVLHHFINLTSDFDGFDKKIQIAFSNLTFSFPSQIK